MILFIKYYTEVDTHCKWIVLPAGSWTCIVQLRPTSSPWSISYWIWLFWITILKPFKSLCVNCYWRSVLLSCEVVGSCNRGQLTKFTRLQLWQHIVQLRLSKCLKSILKDKSNFLKKEKRKFFSCLTAKIWKCCSLITTYLVNGDSLKKINDFKKIFL